MDDSLRTLERRLRAAGGDPALAREYRAALERLDPEHVGPRLDELQGALAVPGAWPREGSERPVTWVRVPVGGHAPLLRPRGPFGPDGAPPAALEERWRVTGDAVWASASVVLVETGERHLEGRCPRTGRLLWTLPSAGPPPGRLDAIEDTERTTILPWCVAPWGAVTVGARFEARLEAPRRGSASWRPRAVERGLPERGTTSIDVVVQVALAPGGAWSSAPPRDAVERARAGEAIAEGTLRLERWEDDLSALEADLLSPGFAVATGWLEEQVWSTYEVGEGGDGRPWLAGAAWEHERAAWAPASNGLDPARFALPPEAGRCRSATAFDLGVLLRTRAPDEPGRLWAAEASGGPARPVAVRLAAGDLDAFDLRFWDEPAAADEVERPRWATLAVAGDLLLVQAGGEVIALGGAA